MESSNPEVVTKATRAPLRCNNVLVPTVVPCSTVAPDPEDEILPTASAMACEGSAGVEKTFRILSVEPSSHTQSVKVPPLSMAILRDGRGGMSFGWLQDESPVNQQTGDFIMLGCSEFLPHEQRIQRI